MRCWGCGTCCFCCRAMSTVRPIWMHGWRRLCRGCCGTRYRVCTGDVCCCWDAPGTSTKHKPLPALTSSQFDEYKSELRKAKSDKPKNLRQAAAREWFEVQEGTLVFGRAEREAAALGEEGTLTLEELKGFAETYVFDQGQRRRLAVHVRREGEALEEGGVVREGLWDLKRGLAVF